MTLLIRTGMKIFPSGVNVWELQKIPWYLRERNTLYLPDSSEPGWCLRDCTTIATIVLSEVVVAIAVCFASGTRNNKLQSSYLYVCWQNAKGRLSIPLTEVMKYFSWQAVDKGDKGKIMPEPPTPISRWSDTSSEQSTLFCNDLRIVLAWLLPARPKMVRSNPPHWKAKPMSCECSSQYFMPGRQCFMKWLLYSVQDFCSTESATVDLCY